ncbi:hypothetical protein ACHAXT_006463 [Thalassiosira profunda]
MKAYSIWMLIAALVGIFSPACVSGRIPNKGVAPDERESTGTTRKLSHHYPQCGERCKSSKYCEKSNSGCDLCVEPEPGMKKVCMPDCDGPCDSSDDCRFAGECNECINGQCVSPTDYPQCGEGCADHDECKASNSGCNLCVKLLPNVDVRACMPDCDGPCTSNDDCDFAGECSQCIDGKCSKPMVCVEGHMRLYEGGFVSHGGTLHSHLKNHEFKGGDCHNGYTRYECAEDEDKYCTKVVTLEKDKLACGAFKRGYHDAEASDWEISSDPTSCSLKVNYCEHNLAGSHCYYTIWEKCTHPFGT